MEKAFVQYLRSLSRSGLRELPTGDDSILSKLQESIAAGEMQTANDSDEPSMSEGFASTAADANEVVRTNESPTTSVAKVAPEPEMVREANPPISIDSTAIDSTATDSTSFDEPKSKRLEVLQGQIRECFQCPELVDNRTQTVFGVGSPDARLCFMGEAPGADEDVQGEPFVGAAGKLLDRIIGACKMAREDVYILNTIKCRPPNNRNPADQECANCRPFLDEQLSILQPEFICCLGGIAAKHLLDTQLSVGRLRGKVHLHQGIKVVVTYHPAYLLRNPDAKRQVWDDMKFLMKEMGQEI